MAMMVVAVICGHDDYRAALYIRLLGKALGYAREGAPVSGEFATLGLGGEPLEVLALA